MSGENSDSLRMTPRRVADNAWTVFPQWSPDLRKARVYEQILLDIILGELPPGGRLDEQELTRRYDAGLAGVREALGRLALEGLVVRRARAGTTVAPLDLLEVRQAVEARRLIEPHCAALAALNATAEDIARLRAAFSGAEGAIRAQDAAALVGMDQRFHEAIARASRNITLARILIPLQHKAARFWVYSMGADTEARLLDEIALHLDVVNCIALRDPDRARAAVLRTLGEFSDDVKRAVNGPGGGGEATAVPRIAIS
jgi:DNA-binding GntR family transcriptional regulator